jgi:cytidylate kinase
MSVRVITVDREYGAGGGVVAAKVADRLGWKLWDHALSEEIARRLGCECGAVEQREEKNDPAYYRLFKAFLRGSFEGSLNAPRLRLVDAECIRLIVEKLLPEIAEAGSSVIVGRGAAYFLGSREDAFHVFVYAPFAERVRRLRANGESEADANKLAETVDRDRAEFIERQYELEWPGRHHFHLMVNSGMGDELAAAIILDAAAKFGERGK